MPGEPKIRGKVNVVLNGLVREGVIAGFRTNFGDHNVEDGLHVIVTVPSERSPDEVQMRVNDALLDVAIGIDIIAERA